MSLQQDINRLAGTRPFDLLPHDALRLIAFSAERMTIAKGESLFHQGEAADCAYFVLAGAVALTATGQSEPKERIVGPGGLIGEVAMIAPVERPASARAQEETVALRIPRNVVVRVLGEFPREAVKIRAALAARTREMAGGLEDLRKRAMS